MEAQQPHWKLNTNVSDDQVCFFKTYNYMIAKYYGNLGRCPKDESGSSEED